MNDRILITGGMGQIGSHLACELYSHGYVDITILDRKKRDSPATSLVESGKLAFIKADLEGDLSNVKKSLEKSQVVFHLAADIVATSKPVSEVWARALKNHVFSTVSLFSNLQNVEYFSFSSSVMTYGLPQYLPVDEQHPTNPFNPYGVGKLAAEKYLQLFSREFGVPTSLLRIASVYGDLKFDPICNRAIPNFLSAAKAGKDIVVYGSGENTRDYVFLKDVINALILAMEHRHNGVLNIACGQPTRIIDLANHIIKLYGSKSKIVHSEQEPEPNIVYSIEKAREAIGYSPHYDIVKGLKEIII